jgi:hypothetical protein
LQHPGGGGFATYNPWPFDLLMRFFGKRLSLFFFLGRRGFSDLTFLVSNFSEFLFKGLDSATFNLITFPMRSRTIPLIDFASSNNSFVSSIVGSSAE